MAAVQYITVARVKEAMRSSYNGADDTVLGDVLTSCCSFLDTYTNRPQGGFLIQQFDELYPGSGDHVFFLNNTPIVSIDRIASTSLPCIAIHNTDPDMGCRATFAVTSTGLTLTYIKSAVTTTNTLTWTSYPTVNDLATAINALGNHWTATVQGGFGTWSSSDLRPTQGAFGARITTAYIWISWFDNPWYRVDEQNGKVWSPMGFHRGVFEWRCTYTAGYVTVTNGVPSGLPDDLTQALAELTAATYYARETNANMQSEGLGPMSYTRLAEKNFSGLSDMAKKTISFYKRRPIPHFSMW